MIQKTDPSHEGPGPRIGVDIGATLAKVAVRCAEGHTELRLVPTHAIEQLAREVESSRPQTIGLTGGGAPEMAQLLRGFDTARVNEFEAWRRGSQSLLRDRDGELPERYLLVSLGTGTSALLVEGEEVTRVGGTALGGGTITGLAAALIGPRDFEEIADLARAGDRRGVDLLLSDIYRTGEAPLPGWVNASSFGKLARGNGASRAPEDLVHAVVGLVGENVGLICGWIAAHTGVDTIVYGGSTLRGNPALAEILMALAAPMGRQAILLSDGEFAGALGVLEVVDSERVGR